MVNVTISSTHQIINGRVNHKLAYIYMLHFRSTYIRDNRSADKVVFKVPTRISPLNESSPFYSGTKLWDKFTEETQRKDTVHAFKMDINRLFKSYEQI